VLSSIGAVVDVDESQMHAVTAVSGSGPAYVFLLAEHWQHAAIELGIEPDTARTLVNHTIRGAAGLLEQSGRTPAELREAVTSPAGTTAAALDVMYRREMPEIIVDAVTAARDRGVELDE
jgi:pyrroline-5-carboxylate reductase